MPCSYTAFTGADNVVINRLLLVRWMMQPAKFLTMNEVPAQFAKPFQPIDPAKFRNPDLTAKGEPRAHVPLSRLDTLWINTGTLCNITCANCYIESSPDQ
jgi:hypothetical protein